jgi:hypothetical protein
MSRRLLIEIRADGHAPHYRRERAGISPFGRPVYANSVECECGWRWGGQWAPKREAESAHHNHLTEVG